MVRRVYHPISVDVEGQAFQIQKGHGRQARVYRKLSSGALQRVQNDDPVLVTVATAFRKGVDEHKAAAEKEEKRRRGWVARSFRWIGALLARWWFSLFPK